jgi:hypothetical protein
VAEDRKPIYRWNGRYFGFILKGYLFDARSSYVGWVEGNNVWTRDGRYLGELVDENYVLRRSGMATPARRALKAAPATPATPARRANRGARAQRGGWEDALEEL